MKKNLFNFNLSNSSEKNGSLWGQETCEPCSSEVERIKKKIDNKKLSEIENDDIDHIISIFGIKR